VTDFRGLAITTHLTAGMSTPSARTSELQRTALLPDWTEATASCRSDALIVPSTCAHSIPRLLNSADIAFEWDIPAAKRMVGLPSALATHESTMSAMMCGFMTALRRSDLDQSSPETLAPDISGSIGPGLEKTSGTET